MKKSKPQTSAFILFFFMIVAMELILKGPSSLPLLFVSIGLLYYATTKQSKSYFLLGQLLLIISLASLWSIRLAAIALFIYFIIKIVRGMSVQEVILSHIPINNSHTQKFQKNKLFQIQAEALHSYEWQDIHIQGIAADLYIDVTKTVLPKGTSFISTRHTIGQVKIDIPYGIPVRIHTTTLLGHIKLIKEIEKSCLNEKIQIQDGYPPLPNQPELIITVATWFGSVEVNRK